MSSSNDKQLIKRSGLFDPEYYAGNYPDVAAAGGDPLDHYVSDGRREGRRPSAEFEPKAYLEANPDLDPAKIDPLLHYITQGKKEGRPLQLPGRNAVSPSVKSFDPLKIGYFFRKLFGVEKRFDLLKARMGALERQQKRAQVELSEYYSRLQRVVYENHLIFIPSADAINDYAKPNWIVPLLSGGLGNQLFQISASYAVARRTHAQLGLNYDLYSCEGQGSPPALFKDTLFRKIKATTVVPEFTYKYDRHKFKEIPRMPHFDMQLHGFFQSGKYFEDFSEEIRQLFVFPKEDVAKAQEFLRKDDRPTVGIHIRLGDYARHTYLKAFDDDYYSKAVAHFPKGMRFVACSDDPVRARELLKGVDVDFFPGHSELADMTLLTLCDNLIMSNSTFSWWSYYLGKKKETVIAPASWFNLAVVSNHSDIYEKSWITI